MPAAQPAFASEAVLVERLLELLGSTQTAWGRVDSLTEWDYGAGRTDVLVRTDSGRLVAFEAKLTSWKNAFYQAYRNTLFADLAYVVMPLAKASAIQTERLFAAQGVGLCGVGPQGLVTLIEARPGRMVLPGTRRRALTSFAGGMLDAGPDAEEYCGGRRERVPAHA